MTESSEFRDALLYPREVAALFRVSVKTVNRWANAGTIPSVKLPSGHHRFKASDMREVLAKMGVE